MRDSINLHHYELGRKFEVPTKYFEPFIVIIADRWVICNVNKQIMNAMKGVSSKGLVVIHVPSGAPVVTGIKNYKLALKLVKVMDASSVPWDDLNDATVLKDVVPEDVKKAIREVLA